MKLQLGLIGTGRMAQIHAQTLRHHADAQWSLVAGESPSERATALAASLGAQYTTAEELVCSPKVDAVVIASASESHSRLSLAALEAGKAVYCEKPIDSDFSRACRVVKTAKANNLFFFCWF